MWATTHLDINSVQMHCRPVLAARTGTDTRNDMQEILDGATAKLWLKDATTRDSSAVDICSAFIKSDALLSLFGNVLVNCKQTRVLARWNAHDLVSGASDLDVYKICQHHGVTLQVHTSFHGKVYKFDPLGVLIGSFNLTGNGFSIDRDGNDEAGVLIPCTPSTNSFVDELFSRSTALDDDLYREMADFISTTGRVKDCGREWPPEIRGKLQVNPQSITKLLVTECLFCSYEEFCTANSIARQHDLSLLGLEESEATNLKYLTERMRRTRLFTWLMEQLLENLGEMYFGKVTARLHDSLFDDPKPYRKDVKDIVANLFSWLRALEISEVIVDRPQHSERIQLARRR
jgi:hypothetical protein